MATPQRPITPAEQRQIASETHMWILDGLAQKTDWSVEDVVFQGGTSLALAWDSPRFSEDLDFVARADLNFTKSINKIVDHIEQGLAHNFPGAKVEVKEKSEGQNAHFTFAVSLPNVLGKVKVKTEFWKVENDLIKGYDGSLKVVAKRGRVNPMIPVASLDQIFADKMVALGARPRLKWRDVFDVWYLDNRSNATIKENPQQFLHYFENTLSLYNTSPAQVRDKWTELLNTPNEEIAAKALTDLKPWVGNELWEKLAPSEVSKMVDVMKNKVREALEVFPAAEYIHLSAEEFREKVRARRADALKDSPVKDTSVVQKASV